ncbi:MAG: protecting protein DprA protein [Candidatus Daviesbacteria bacterium GW2011_GWB1_41_5]|uniref:Protecting protein DprA protein n=1 Tax=Candidatus Daviesbacteria bacterium GW2011_GWB1_41_5 TaxID=1618429 RepID=A0A0G0ZMY6_9BACT|nr:MAG: protecting protein DprA protein [Candidatus Daviesbacteria bacterium GW2011_GWB1_41_5]
MDIDNVGYLLALHSINGLGPIRLKAVLEYFKDPKLAWFAKEYEFLQIGIPKNVATLLVETRKKLDPEKYTESIQKSGIKWMTIFDLDYPKLLKEIYDPPVLFYYKGEILPSDKRSIAVVGTRKITGYGKLVTEKMVRELVGYKVTIVSGLARGVDTQAHKTTIENQGRTLAVLGGGLNKIFPPENTTLAQKIATGFGAVISEFPPDALSLPGNFPARNRIISGLSLATLVTEAAQDSGSLITAKLALEEGRDVFAVPGPITSDLSMGPSLLIKQGARLVTSANEILEELGIEKSQVLMANNQVEITLSELEKRIVGSLENEQKHMDEICRALEMPASMVSASLIKMEIQGLVKNLGGGNYIRIC